MFTTQDSLDSRYLRSTDCYGQRFMRAGTYYYNVVQAGGGALSDERPYVIQVSDCANQAGMQQHNIVLSYTDNAFSPDRVEIHIALGDLVLWSSVSQTGPAYEVVGQQEFFGSVSLVNECGFSHIFGQAGEYEWGDINGSGIGGVVRVTAPACHNARDIAQWRERLAKGTVVMVADGKCEPAVVEVEVGQTVFFAIVAGKGITVTDKRLFGVGSC